jgi:hypothetical protein
VARSENGRVTGSFRLLRALPPLPRSATSDAAAAPVRVTLLTGGHDYRSPDARLAMPGFAIVNPAAVNNTVGQIPCSEPSSNERRNRKLNTTTGTLATHRS